MTFASLGLAPVLCQALQRLGYTAPTPIQTRAIPLLLGGRDVLAGAQTGTGKTAAFALPILQRLLLENKARLAPRRPRALVMVPTRELALQVHEALRNYGRDTGLRSSTVFGGVGMGPQVEALARGLHAVVATPGRLLDHMQQRSIDLAGVELLVLDEADRMLDMGFLPALRRILAALPKQRQTVLLSATLTEDIQRLAARFMVDPARVQIVPANQTAANIRHLVYPVAQERKRDLLLQLLANPSHLPALVFCRTRHGANRLSRQLRTSGLQIAAIHGDKSQSQRTRSLDQFKAGGIQVLVATDVAARGLHIQQLPLVVNYDLPAVPEDYIHRIGRTGRAGLAGMAISLVAPRDREALAAIERLLGQRIQVQVQVPAAVPAPAAPRLQPKSRRLALQRAQPQPKRPARGPAPTGKRRGVRPVRQRT